MALARIITRSQACSRELALDLLARGYAVEIVSPDKIPDNIADLELRLDAGPGDQLIATVESHDGERSASLDFVHHLKAPMVDFKRRPPELPPPVHAQAVRVPEHPVRFNVEPNVESVTPPAEAPKLAPKNVSPAAPIPRNRDIDSQAAPHLIVPQVPSPQSPPEPPGYFPVVDAVVAPPATVPATISEPATVAPRQKVDRRDHSEGWRWRAALTFAAVVLLAAILGFGLRRIGKSSAPNSAGLPVEKGAAVSIDANSRAAADSGMNPRKPDPLAALPPAVPSEANSGPVAKAAPVAQAGAPGRIPPARFSRKHTDDSIIARNTVTYLDKRFEPAPKPKSAKQFARRHPKSRPHGGGVIAANSVTYLDKPVPKPVK